ncbi:selenium cofactor biosynthesis protein YqeC [Vibrio mediterranei]|uniref:selenium cofactor biosynthesis protein YqeC n=1 Tax=Vibrio mediterranei TaxID=689 RepID=UPI00406815F5
MPVASNNSFSTFCSSFLKYKPSVERPLTIALVGGGGKTHLLFWLAREFKRMGHNVCATTTTKMYKPLHSDLDQLCLFSDAVPLAKPGISFIYRELIRSHKTKAPQKVKGLSLEQLDALRQRHQYSVFVVEADGANRLPLKAPAGHEPCIPYQCEVVIGVTGAESIFKPANGDFIHRWHEFSLLTDCKRGALINEQVLKPLINHRQGMFKSCLDKHIKIWVINKIDLAVNQQQLEQLALNIFDNEPLLSMVALTQLTAPEPIHRILNRTP